MKFIKRRGSALILALVVALIGGAIGVMIFQTAGTFLGISVPQRRVYADGIIAANYIEKAKGEVMFKNISDDSMLRGSANGSSIDGYNSDDQITSLSELETSVSYLNERVETGGGVRRVDTKVFDAVYKTSRIAFTDDADYQNLPPSYFTTGGGGGPGGFLDSGSTGENYEDTIGVGSGSGGADYTGYGIYVVQVKIFNVDSNGNKTGNPIRTTEEAFRHFSPSTSTP